MGKQPSRPFSLLITWPTIHFDNTIGVNSHTPFLEPKMSEAIGTFALEHISNTYTTDPNNEITNHTNWKGTAEGYGTVFGTLTFAPTPLSQLDEKLDGGNVRWTGQGFLEDGTAAAATGAGTWSKVPGKHAWKVEYILDLNDGSQIKSVGEIALDTLKFTGTNYSV
jgi:hypothetical protein